MYVTIDRFEGKFAVVELPDGRFANLPRALVPAGTGEGCVLKIEYDPAETERRQKEARTLFDEITRK